MSKSAALREHFERRSLVRAVGAHNALGAKLVEESGFEAVWQSSFEVSASYGLPDASLLGMNEFLSAAASMNRAVEIPIIADCDTGFGGPLNAAFAAQEYEARGIAAICIEDKQFPKMNSFADGGQHLVPADVFAAKIEAAKAAQAGSDFVVIARTESLIAGLTVDDALARAHEYVDSGADAVLIHSKSTRPDEILEFGRRWSRRVPLVAVPTTYFSVTEAQLIEAGFSTVIYANQSIRASVQAMRDVLATINAHQTGAGVEGGISTMSDLFALQGMPTRFVATS